MITAEHPNGALFSLKGEEISWPKDFKCIKTAFDGYRPEPQNGDPEAFFFYEFVEPLGFVIKEFLPEPEETETDY
jgi:hypothetical protein